MKKRFLQDDSGAVGIDWVVIGATVVGIGTAATSVMTSGISNLSSNIETQLTSTSISTSFGSSDLLTWQALDFVYMSQTQAEADYQYLSGKDDFWLLMNLEMSEIAGAAGYDFFTDRAAIAGVVSSERGLDGVKSSEMMSGMNDLTLLIQANARQDVVAPDSGLQGMYDHLSNTFVDAANQKGLSYNELPEKFQELDNYWLNVVKETHEGYLEEPWWNHDRVKETLTVINAELESRGL